eukprot:TRINITY_DN58602_c1_g1_i1.p1 TRINITY_DN58602_c1_g1~~TRINITY_DN58602_c1_g1_i1.p1  ORF type:complete len:287 (-),score=20.23 TRINITY_DN58602_c1_g1_i1:213-1073(-)
MSTTQIPDKDSCQEQQETIQQKLNSPFMQKYVKWYEEKYMKPYQFPVFNKQYLDIERLWNEVQKAGGSAKVCLSKMWAQIGRTFQPPNYMTNLSTIMKSIFERYLLEYEQLNFPNIAMPLRITPKRRRKSNNSSKNKSCSTAALSCEGASSGRSLSFTSSMTTSMNSLPGEESVEQLKAQLRELHRYIQSMKLEHQQKMLQIQQYNEMITQQMVDQIWILEQDVHQTNNEYMQLVRQLGTVNNAQQPKNNNSNINMDNNDNDGDDGGNNDDCINDSTINDIPSNFM